MDRRSARVLITKLRTDADRICVRFALRYKVIEAERTNVKLRFGICYSDGTIKIRLRHVTTGEPLKYSSLVSTLCHELAHLRHFDHGPGFHDFYSELLRWARREGIYQPRTQPRFAGAQDSLGAVTSSGTVRPPRVPRRGPEQLTLF